MQQNKFRLIKNARLMPLYGTMDKFTAGVYENEECLPDSLLYRGSPAILQPPSQRLEGTYIFGGYMFAHYGHFLLESLSRVWAIRQCSSKFPLLFIIPKCDKKLIPFQASILGALGIQQKIILVREPLEVENLVYSPPGCELLPKTWMTDEQMAALGQIDVAPEAENRKIWLSRSRYEGGGVDNEAAIENVLAKGGWQIVHTQDLKLQDQVRLIAESALVAGFSGTAFFNALLARQAHGRFIVISRTPRGPGGPISTYMKQKVKCYEEHIFPMEYRSGDGAGKRYYLSDPVPLLRLLLQAQP